MFYESILKKNTVGKVAAHSMDEIMRMNTEQLQEQVKELRIEQHILLSGWVYGFTDRAHKKLHDLWKEGKTLPIDFSGAIVFYTNPSPAPRGCIIGAVGPAAAQNMDIYLDEMMSTGVIATIGKGERSQAAYDALTKYGGVYLTAVGGTGALLSKCIEEWEVVALQELGEQAICRYKVKDLPVTVAADSTGRNLFDNGKFTYRRL